RDDDRDEVDPEQESDEGERDGHDDLEPADRILQVAELAHPFDPRARRQLHLLGDLALRLLNRASEIAVADAELDRQVALLAFAVDVGWARDELAGGALVEGNRREAVGSLDADAQILDRFRILPDLRREPYHDGKVPVAARLVEVAGRFAADGRSDRGIDVPGSKPITRRPRAIDFDLHRRLAERGEDGEIGNPRHRGS